MKVKAKRPFVGMTNEGDNGMVNRGAIIEVSNDRANALKKLNLVESVSGYEAREKKVEAPEETKIEEPEETKGSVTIDGEVSKPKKKSKK